MRSKGVFYLVCALAVFWAMVLDAQVLETCCEYLNSGWHAGMADSMGKSEFFLVYATRSRMSVKESHRMFWV